ncbi:MAG: hypothetical protein IJD04_02800 [Desulfovibrionaceae bacterium]|nr:hypothetical protein [Desulfovibrionaceae bacterium]
MLADKEAALPKAGIYISSPELRFWAAPELTRDERLGRNAGLVSKVLHAYGGRIMTFEYGGRITPNITAVKADGHTPGHTAFLLESAGERLLIIGDLLHGALLQFPHPDENTAYDMSQADARATRRRILSWVSEENIPVAGMHIPWPGIGYVQKAGDGFVFKPLQ